jgi:hypothetical protein
LKQWLIRVKGLAPSFTIQSKIKLKEPLKYMQPLLLQFICGLIAFIILSIGVFILIFVNASLQNDYLSNLIDSALFVFNCTGALLGIYNIYQGFKLIKAKRKIGISIFIIGIFVLILNVWSLIF